MSCHSDSDTSNSEYLPSYDDEEKRKKKKKNRKIFCPVVNCNCNCNYRNSSLTSYDMDKLRLDEYDDCYDDGIVGGYSGRREFRHALHLGCIRGGLILCFIGSFVGKIIDTILCIPANIPVHPLNWTNPLRRHNMDYQVGFFHFALGFLFFGWGYALAIPFSVFGGVCCYPFNQCDSDLRNSHERWGLVDGNRTSGTLRNHYKGGARMFIV